MQLALAWTPSFAITRQDNSQTGDSIVAKGAFVRIIAILLAALHAALAITAAMEKSPTFDEPTHLTAGYSYALLWLGRSIISIWRPTTQSLMANRYNTFGLLGCALTFVNANQLQTLETRS